MAKYNAINALLKNKDGEWISPYTADTLKKSQITNCLLEVPQRIKYTLEEGVLTIKAGSVVIYPFGTTNLTAQYPKGTTFLNNNLKVYDTQYIDGKFFVWAESQNDISCGTTQSTMDNRTVWFNPQGGVNTGGGDFLFSGTTTPTGDYAVWYDTTRNIITRTIDGGVTWTDYQSFPVAVGAFTRDYGFNSVQVFNGLGYIGSTIWVDKGIKGLAPNGRNDDGTLRNAEIVNNSVKTVTTNYTLIDGLVALTDDGVYEIATTTWNYNQEKNVYEHSSGITSNHVVLASASYTNGVVSNFQPKQPFRAVDYNDLNNLLPTGAVISSASSTSPQGFLLANGSAVSRTTYAKLFNAIGTTYGTGDGSTTFNLPNYSNYNFVTSATVSVKGNGKALGLVISNQTSSIFPMKTGSSNSDGISMNASQNTSPAVGASMTSTAISGNTQKAVGISPNSSLSGLTGTASTAKLNWYIKY